jgi:hypothetical protein
MPNIKKAWAKRKQESKQVDERQIKKQRHL